MICQNCGTDITENIGFCPVCGKQLGMANNNNEYVQQGYTQNVFIQQGYSQNGYAPQGNMPVAQQPKKDKKKIVIVAIIGFVVALLLLILFLFRGRSFDSTLKKYINGQLKGDAGQIIELMPDELIDAICEEEAFLNKKELVIELDEMLEEELKKIEEIYGKGWKYSYEIVEEEDYTTSEVRDLRKEYQEDYEIKLDITEIKEVKVEITMSSKDDSLENTTSMRIQFMKIGNSWYILDV